MKFVFTLGLFFLFACSSSTDLNQVSDSLIVLKGGQKDEKKWKDTLDFNRYSWYKGANMKYDLFVAKLNKSSPFYQWIGRSQQESLKDCDQLYLTLLYAGMPNSNTGASLSELREDFNIVGLKRYSLPIFSSYLQNHYFYLQWNLKNHLVYGHCKDSNLKDVEVSIPNFKTVRVMR